MAIGKAYEAHFKPAAKEAQRAAGGDKKSDEAKESLSANRHEAIKTSKKAAEAMGMRVENTARNATLRPLLICLF